MQALDFLVPAASFLHAFALCGWAAESAICGDLGSYKVQTEHEELGQNIQFTLFHCQNIN